MNMFPRFQAWGACERGRDRALLPLGVSYVHPSFPGNDKSRGKILFYVWEKTDVHRLPLGLV